METPSWPALIRALIGRQALTAEQTAWAMNEIMEGAATPAQIAGFGVAKKGGKTQIHARSRPFERPNWWNCGVSRYLRDFARAAVTPGGRGFTA